MLKQLKSKIISAVRPFFTWLHLSLHRAKPHSSSDQQWITTLQSVGRQIETLAGSTETEFLSVGSRLQEFYLNAQNMSKMSASVVGLMTGDGITGAMDGLGHILKRVKELQNESRKGKNILYDILEMLGKTQNSVAGFKKIVKTLRVLCVSTKIESARLGEEDSDFDILAEDTRKLALEIENKSNSLFSQSTSLALQIQQTLSRVLDIEAVQREQALVILENTASNLTTLSQKHKSASDAIQRIAAQYDAVTGNIGEVVASLQFHDITRQRIEHVKAALDELIHRLRDVDSGANGGSLPEALSQISTVGDICELQSAQLRHAGIELVAAVDNILRNLRGIARNSSGMSQAMMEVVGDANAAGLSFVSEMERGLSPVTSALSRYVEENRNLATAISLVLILSCVQDKTNVR